MKLFAALFSCALVLTNAPARDYYVSPSGKDTNPGTRARPFKSLERAQKAVRSERGASLEHATVYLLDGSYSLEQSLELDPRDSNVTWTSAPRARPVVTGARQIRGWSKQGDKLWVTEIPEVKAGQWSFNQLYVNGELRKRARIPNTGFLRVAGCPEGTPKTANYHKDCQTFEFYPGDIRPDWTNLEEVRVIVYHFWTDSHLPIKYVDTSSNLVTFAHKAGKVFTDDFTEDGARYIVENVFEGLDAPGEWYVNRKTGTVYYVPLPGEDMGSAEIVAPLAPAFMHLRGEPRSLRYVENVVFKGLTFRYTNFELPPGNSNDQQGSASVSAAVTMLGAHGCRFENCEFANLGTWAIEAGRGCTDNTFIANEIRGVAAGAFRINGGTERDHPLERTERNTISDNHIHQYGQVYPSAVGVLLMHSEENLVVHNHIHDGFYTAISLGWVWGYQRSISQGNRVEFNHIHDIGKGGLLSDMGGIYTLGVSPGTTLRNNIIHDVDANHYGGWGIYHDEGSTHLLVESNIVFRTKFAAVNIHFAKEVTVRNNIFALGRLEQLSRGRQEPHKSLFFENNIVYWSSGELYAQNWKDAPYTFYFHPKNESGTRTVTNTFECDWNLYFRTDKPVDQVTFAGRSWSEWQEAGKDRNSLFADPMFVDPESGQFELKKGSPAFALGFRPILTQAVGPRVAVGPAVDSKSKKVPNRPVNSGS